MRKSQPGNSIYVEIGVWYDEARGNIHIASNDVSGFHTTVRSDARQKRCHPNLFGNLAKLLRDNDAPAPPEVSRGTLGGPD